MPSKQANSGASRRTEEQNVEQCSGIGSSRTDKQRRKTADKLVGSQFYERESKQRDGQAEEEAKQRTSRLKKRKRAGKGDSR